MCWMTGRWRRRCGRGGFIDETAGDARNGARIVKSPADPSTVSFIDLGIRSSDQFWQEIVEPDYSDFLESPTIRRSRAITASLAEFMEWQWHEINLVDRPKWKPYKAKLTAECPSLGLLLDIYETFKHRGLNRAELTIAASSMPIRSGRGGMGGYGAPSGGYGVGALSYGSGLAEPVIYCRDGTRMWLIDATTEVRAFWLARRSSANMEHT